MGNEGTTQLTPTFSAISIPLLTPSHKAMLKSDDAPSFYQVPEIQEAVLKRDKAISAIKVDIEALEKLQKKLQAERDDLQALLSPFRPLATETLLEIFKLALEGYTQLWRSRSGVYFLSLVCKRWKIAIYSAPEFWTTIHCKIGSGMTLAPEYLSSRLARCGGLTVDLNIQLTDTSNATNLKAPILPLPLEMVHSLNVVAKDLRALSRFLGTAKLSLLRLVTLALPYGSTENLNGLEIAILELASAPLLQQVCISGHSLQSIHLPLSQLRNVDIRTNERPKLVYDTLFQCTNIEKIVLRLERQETSTRDVHPPLKRRTTLPRLRDITLLSDFRYTQSPVDFSLLLELLTAPALDKMRLDGVVIPPLSVMIPFASRNFGTLTDLDFECVDFEEGWQDILRYCVNLEFLGLHETEIDTQDLFTLLTPSTHHPSPPVLPRLKSLLLWDDVLEEDTVASVLEFIEERGWSDDKELRTDRLLSVTIYLAEYAGEGEQEDDEIDNDMLQRFLQIEERGLDLSFQQWRLPR